VTAADVRSVTFPPALRGYWSDHVDAFLERVRGYAEAEMDDFLDEVALTLRVHQRAMGWRRPAWNSSKEPRATGMARNETLVQLMCGEAPPQVLGSTRFSEV